MLRNKRKGKREGGEESKRRGRAGKKREEIKIKRPGKERKEKVKKEKGRERRMSDGRGCMRGCEGGGGCYGKGGMWVESPLSVGRFWAGEG